MALFTIVSPNRRVAIIFSSEISAYECVEAWIALLKLKPEGERRGDKIVGSILKKFQTT